MPSNTPCSICLKFITLCFYMYMVNCPSNCIATILVFCMLTWLKKYPQVLFLSFPCLFSYHPSPQNIHCNATSTEKFIHKTIQMIYIRKTFYLSTDHMLSHNSTYLLMLFFQSSKPPFCSCSTHLPYPFDIIRY